MVRSDDAEVDDEGCLHDLVVGQCADCAPVPAGPSRWVHRFGNYVPPVLEALGLAEVEHNPRNNRRRAI